MKLKMRLLSVLLVVILIVSIIPAPVKAAEYTSQLMSTVLASNERYSISTLKVNLFDYDPETFNAALGDGDHFKFVGYNTGVGSNGGVNDSTSTYAKQGIVQSTLKNGLPVFNYVSNGEANGKRFFDPQTAVSGKTSYSDVDFEVVFDKQTRFYEYKSSANHAQYNSSTNRIELYADTLSTYNAWTHVMDLTKANSFTRLDVSSQTETAISAKINALTSENRMDVYFNMPVDNIPGNKINEIYMQVKVPVEAGTVQAKVYYTTDGSTSFNETQAFKVNYKATGDWQTIVLNPSGDTWDNGTITNLRIDPIDNYDSADSTNAEDAFVGGWVDTTVNGENAGLYDIELRNLVLFGGTGYTGSYGYSINGGFYPFSEIQDSYPSYKEFSYDNWFNHMNASTEWQDYSTRSIGNPTPTSLTSELSFGMVLQVEFYLPVATPEEDLIFYFSGDDDLWVFCDNQLVLDIGGGHGAISGTVNFTAGYSEVSNAVQVSGFAANGGNAKKTKTDLPTTVYAPGKHTLKMFYLERCGSVSNCQFKYNLPLTPQGSVVVSKDVEEVNGAELSALAQENFVFKLDAVFKGQGESPFEFPCEFSHISAGGSATAMPTDDSGQFTLKHGEKAVFEIPELYDVTVTEITDVETDVPSGYEYKGTTVNGNDGRTMTQRTVKDQLIEYSFVNRYDEIETTFNYIPVNPAGCPDNVKGTVELTGDSATKTYDTTGVSETIGVRVGVPVGSTATGTNSVKFVGWYSDAECTQKISENAVFIPTRESGTLWQGTTYYAKFEYMYGNLKITKNGIQSVDHHEEAGKQKEEKQSTIFHISGTSNSGVKIDMDVVIHGNGSVTVNEIPVGTYTVTEKKGWSWRYSPNKESQNVTVLSAQTSEVIFENTRDESKWLSGDNFFKNLFNGQN